ncbi:MAG: methyltransferase domain-containing protein [Firmicutes bacterium]|nr:methyltransferase domain-containing protein [Bacillota bacterium]
MNWKSELDGKTWLSYSISVWDDIRKSSAEKEMAHPALFPVQLAERLVRIFSRPGETVLDPFCGTGTALVAAQRLGRRAVGLDISAEYLALAEKRLREEGAEGYRLLLADARQLGEMLKETVGFCVTSPPYWDILNQKRTADKRERRHYGNLDEDLGLIGDYQEFLDTLVSVFRSVYGLLRPRAYCCIIVMDLRKKDCFFPLHMDLACALKAEGFTLDDLIIWDRRREYNRLRPLGYPHVFRVNRVHEYLLIFQKR